MIKILLIEDNLEIRENITEILELGGYQVFTTSNGKDGVDTAIKERPNLILCDIMMPVLDGYGVLYLIQRHTELQGIPFIFLTAKSERHEMRKGMELGADDYITKPFHSTELLNAIEVRLAKVDNLKRLLPGNLEELMNSFLLRMAGITWKN
ncbi:response regulator transcription factor [Niabella hibiscisoli]|uniref:response regulator transcription factor n=1 Tax=Niabella hibiscisoli TaxID=1825928 RepID=UPI001F115FD8|nr:response regulator [Niabella hibiscisoli]MCH5720833.1 response regulator [Niabella hibiscisoli]